MYLCILGRYPELSRAELAAWGEVVTFDDHQGWALVEDLKWENPRELPKSPEQIFLDRLGGTQRMAQVLGEFFSPDELQNKIISHCTELTDERTFLVGFSFWGAKPAWSKKFMFETYDQLKAHLSVNVRLANPDADNLTSGRIFHDKLLKKGTEFIIIHQNDSWLLAQTKANQNLRNYELRDRKKNFRDSEMGMLPPKLAQILINLARPGFEDLVIDPFCGSGTVNIEAAISGYRTLGSDLDGERTLKAQQNFQQMAQKFRYEPSTGNFYQSDALDLPWEKLSGVMTSEGWLGKNFEQAPSENAVRESRAKVLELWQKLLSRLSESRLHAAAFCLPAWNQKGHQVSLFQHLKPTIHHSPFTIQPFESGDTFFYQRPGAFVAREICVLRRKN